ncbi:mitochondrial/chloroplast ribosomal protein L54/L37 [Dichomitus squalens]|uniref:Large ribosomal subunit protein mL54 n=1 Tax=Dichomitus squalens TaxID=114155 RepID=A0A4V2K9W2_9APHY|nr:mitochondrial/chloroplast ribosomal protein L54/L37 [Dichomitus squalens LYAD-421 SS1]EJF66249.1 mitochondrial/chloroplast ribosomal protein L54/L37 [Dichomitus squalens LYAD-421 SS1]TBU50233.1 mitochondrial/chloroplast ribosomal protein L54/L37 [Dichomitus squalens]TBU65358.1 mitochondrial/chloroplast ribosomal protein L54/L37 [Dichomitus squalens]
MSFVQALRRQARLNAFWAPRRCLASQSAPAAALAASPDSTGASPKASGAPKAFSACPENMVMQGLNYLKGQPEVVAQADDAYPPWLWTILDKKELPDDGPGGLAEKKRLRKANRQRIRDQNFMKTQ